MTRVAPAGSRLLQITDTHLFADPSAQLAGVNVEQRFEATLAAMTPWARTASGLLHTGDLVHDGSVAGYQRLRQRLETLALPGRVTPGNHDDRARLQSVFAGGRVTAERLLHLGNWCIVMLDSLVSGEVAGHLPARELTALADALAATDAAHVLLALHHQPLAVGTAWLDAIGLDNADALMARIAAEPRIRAVVFGHVHHAVDREVAGCRYLATPASAAQFLAGADQFTIDRSAPGFRWLDLLPDGAINTAVEIVAHD